MFFQVTLGVETAFYSVPRCLISEFNVFATGDTDLAHRLDLYNNNGTEEQPQEENDIQQQPLPEALEY